MRIQKAGCSYRTREIVHGQEIMQRGKGSGKNSYKKHSNFMYSRATFIWSTQEVCQAQPSCYNELGYRHKLLSVINVKHHIDSANGTTLNSPVCWNDFTSMTPTMVFPHYRSLPVPIELLITQVQIDGCQVQNTQGESDLGQCWAIPRPRKSIHPWFRVSGYNIGHQFLTMSELWTYLNASFLLTS